MQTTLIEITRKDDAQPRLQPVRGGVPVPYLVAQEAKTIERQTTLDRQASYYQSLP